MVSEQPFKRINFFHGFLTRVEDWQAAQSYEIDKRKLHNRALHGPGVVPRMGGGLAVKARGRSEMGVEVAPGYAIDGAGNDIWIPETQMVPLNAFDFKLPGVLHLVVRYVEEPTDHVAFKENPAFQGHKRIEEKYKLEFTQNEPELAREVELARVSLKKGARKLTDARDVNNPADGELDLRFVPRAGVSGTTLQPSVLWQMRKMLALARDTYGFLRHGVGIQRASEVLQAVLTMEMFLLTGQLQTDSFIAMVEVLLSLQKEVVADLDANHPQQASTREFLNYKNQIRYLEQLFGEGQTAEELTVNLIGFQVRACEALEGLHAKKIEAATDEEELPMDEILEAIKIRSKDFAASLTVKKKKFKLFDAINVLDRDDEKKHSFEVKDYEDSYRSRQNFKYPDTEKGTAVKDEGVAFEGGVCQFTLSGAKPGKPVILVFRIDYTHGEWVAGVKMNKGELPDWAVTGRDRKFRWRNWPYVIPADKIDKEKLTFEITYQSAERDINVFHVWAYQPG
jgi:hypothetical protein